MTSWKSLKTSIVLLVFVTLTGCASIPSDFEQIPSRSWQEPERTRLGGFFDDFAPDDASLSGVRLLSNPREAFLARFGFADLAEHTLDLQYYLWNGDLTGKLLIYRALQAADRGVKVRLLIDDIYHTGRDISYETLDSHPNMEVRIFNPIGNRGAGRWANFVYRKGKLNHRMHNKIFLVDSAVAILGGRNIGDDYFGVNADHNFRDLDVLAVGPAAKDAGEAFDTYWNSPAAVPISALVKKPVADDALDRGRKELEASLDTLVVLPYKVPVDREKTLAALIELAHEMEWAETEIIIDSLERFQGGSESVFTELSNRLLADARDEILIETAYLIPSKEGIAVTATATERGVRVRILTNSLKSNNHSTVHAHYKKYRKRMIEAGIELHEFRPDPALLEYFKEQEDDARIEDSHAGIHTKSFVVDGRISLIGSYNMDPRSRIWNSEIGLLITSASFGAKVAAFLESGLDPANSYRVTISEKGKLQWTTEGPDGEPVVWEKEPNSKGWDRFKLNIMKAIPMESEL